MTKPRAFALLLMLALTLAGCATSSTPRTVTQALPASDSAFGRSVQRQASAHEGRSGFRLLPNSTEAFHARAELIRNAQSSIDLQYYIVHDGLSTRALVHELLQAADRGVRVRILLDDTTSDGLDEVIATLAAHPKVQIRVFNPLHLGRSTGVTRALAGCSTCRCSTGACTTSCGWWTTAWPSSAGATWVTNTSTPSPT